MDPKLRPLFSVQSGFISLQNYDNEYETLRNIFEKLPKKVLDFCSNTSLEWLKILEEDEDIEFEMKDNDEKIKESNDLRKEGNQMFTAEREQKNVLGACRLYNDAIFAALECGGVEVALGFANRAMALQTFGYYQQAYDDCVCALQCGYPETMRHKIVTRQSYCAIKLQNVEALEIHLKDLQQIPLNECFRKQLKEIEDEFQSMKSTNKMNDITVLQDKSLNRESQEIIDTATGRGRVMKAKCFIPKNALIFSERAPSFVPVGDGRRLCHQCGITNFIPYPCFQCRGRVIYCSLKCQDLHRSVHDYECAGYRFQLFAHVGIAHLALRAVLDNGLLSIADNLKMKPSTAEMWNSLNEGGDIWHNKQLPYAESLRMISHLDKMTLQDIEWFALVSYLLVVYLKHYTKFFDELKKYNSECDWELLTASLILHHIGQLITNAHMLTTIVAKPLFFSFTDFHLLNDRIWSSPWHLKPGYLNTFSYYDDLAALNLPYLSICNHSCVQSFQPKFSGRYISTFALRDLKKGEEITNCYDLDYRKAKRSSRRQRLQATYNFDCECENCLLPEEDVDFNQYHRYRCDNKDCNQIFVPILPKRPSLNWWQKTEADPTVDETVYCTKCGCEQRFEWHYELKHLLDTVCQTDTRRRLYQLFKSLENILLGLHDARAHVSLVLCSEWVKLPYLGIPLNDQDYREFIEMVKYSLECTKSQSCINSIEYVAEMAYLWDLTAIGKYKCSKSEKEEMLFALSIISDDLKVIFQNYYNDYIKDN